MAGTSKAAAKPTTGAKRGTAGTRGPVPKRSSERRRRNKETEVETVPVDAPLAVAPPADESWHRVALDWYASLQTSGQALFYEPSDWQAARYLAEVMSRNLKAKRFSAQLFAAVWAGMSDLLTTEADRRRVRMEIERRSAEPEQQPAGVIAIAGYRERLAAGGGKKGG